MTDKAKASGRLISQSYIALSETIVTSERDVPAANFSLKNEKYPVAIEICRKFLLMPCKFVAVFSQIQIRCNVTKFRQDKENNVKTQILSHFQP